MTRKTFTLLAVFLLLLISNALRAQSIDPTLAAMIVLYTEKAESTLQSQEEAMLLESTGHVWIKEEVDATADIQKEFNDYLDTFHGIIALRTGTRSTGRSSSRASRSSTTSGWCA